MKRVLIIAYYFPPLGWSGVQRTLKYVKYLSQYGWEPVVLTVGETKFSVKDQEMETEVPNNTVIIRIDDVFLKKYTDAIREQLLRYVEPALTIIGDNQLIQDYLGEIDQKLEQIRNMVLLPDGSTPWAFNVISEIESKIDLKNIDLIYTTSSPYSAHLVGYHLKQKWRIPWVADFRDEWTNNPYYNFDECSIRFKLEKDLEARIVHYADQVVTISTTASDNYVNLFGLNPKKVHTITNGYDEADFDGLAPTQAQNEKFLISHNGSFYLVRRPDTFVQALNHLINQGLIDKNKVEINFIGKSDPSVQQEISNIDEHRTIQWFPYLPHLESLQMAANSNILLLVVGADPKVKSVYTGKVFEYLRLKKPILAISPRGSLVEQLMERTGCGVNFEYNDVAGMEEYILSQYRDWENHRNTFSPSEAEIHQYERRLLTGKLAAVFDELARCISD